MMCLVCLVALALVVGRAGEPTSEIDSGLGVLDNFSLTDANGQDFVLYDDAEKYTGTVLAWTSVDCPIAKLYAPRLARLAKEYGEEGIRFLGVNPNLQDTESEIRERAELAAIDFPILLDPMQVVTDMLGVERTTEVVLLDQDMNIVYRGAVDDQYEVGAQKPRAHHEYLIEAMEALLTKDAPETTRTDAPGCLVGRVANPSKVELTYYEDIAPIIHKQCFECHRSGQVAPMAFESFEDVRGWAPMIAEVVANSRMPPWHADPQHDNFDNRRLLTATERAKLVLWSEQGAAEGSPENAPEPPQFEDDTWNIGKPDLVVELPAEQSIPAEGTVPYRYVLVDPELTEDHWVQAVEIRPGNLAVTHHVLVLLVPADKTVDQIVGNARAEAFLDLGYYAVNVPGSRPNIWPEGTGKFLPKGSRFLFQLHYTPIGVSTTDRTRMALRYAKSPVEREVRTRGIGNTRLKIPPDSEATFFAKHRFDKPIELLTLFPHMHTRGASFSYELIGFDKDQVLLNVPEYDFNWQNLYRFDDPVRIEAGEAIFCSATYDNTEENPFNPDYTKTVRWGDQTWEEMMIGYIDYVELEE